MNFGREVFINDHVMGFLYTPDVISTAREHLALTAKQLHLVVLSLIFLALFGSLFSLTLMDGSQLKI